MADNTLQNGTANIATDDIAGVHYQINKIGHGLADATPVHTSATNPLPIVALQNSLVSTANSSVANLAGAAVFTGTSEDVSDYSAITVSVFSSHVSATDGLSVQQSTNGTDWDFPDVFSIPAATGKTFSVAVIAKFFRVVYTNGATLTTSFRLQAIYSKSDKKGSSVRPQDARTNDNDFEEVLTYPMGFDGTNWNRLRATVANGLLTDVSRIVAALPAGANVIGALTANQSVNNAQIGGVAVAAGSGISGTGVQRVVLATDVIQPAIAEGRAATLHVTATAAVNTAITATLPAPGAGLFHYVTSIQLVKLYSVIGVAAGAGVVITSTNLPGTPAWTTEQLASAAGSAPMVINYAPATPLKSAAANIATTFVAPAQLQTIWRWNISYFTAA